MSLSTAEHVWNRAALEAGGSSPRAGDRALVAVLATHGLVMDGGFPKAIDGLTEEGLAEAVDGFRLLGLDGVATLLRERADDRALSEWTEEREGNTTRQYAALVPNEEALVASFERFFREHEDQFAPTEDDAASARPRPRVKRGSFIRELSEELRVAPYRKAAVRALWFAVFGAAFAAPLQRQFSDNPRPLSELFIAALVLGWVSTFPVYLAWPDAMKTRAEHRSGEH